MSGTLSEIDGNDTVAATGFVTSVTVSLLDQQIYTALRAFLLAILPPTIQVVQGQDNRVAEPSVPDFVIMQMVMRSRIETNTDTYLDGFFGTPPVPGIKNSLAPTQVTVQLDVHGPNGADNTQIITTLLRDTYGCIAFGRSGFAVQPLYASEPRQVPFINGENQYETRWTIDAVLQANAVVTVPQEFAAAIAITPAEIDAVYPP